MLSIVSKLNYFTILGRHRKRCQRMTCLIACLALLICMQTPTAFAQVPLVENDVQLRGAQATLSIPIVIEGNRSQSVKFNFQWRLSGLIEPKRSTVNVSIRGQIRSSQRLSDVGNDGWILNLRPLPPGQHELVLQVYLRSKDEDCIPLPESLWITLLPTSTMQGASLTKNTIENSTVAVRDFPQNWLNASISSAQGSLEANKPKLALSHDLPWDAAMAAAFLKTQLFLMSRGVTVQTDASDLKVARENPQSSRQLTLRAFDRLPSSHPAIVRWNIAKETRFVLHAPTSTELEIITKDAEGVQLAVELLANDALRNLCHERVCSSSELSSQLSMPAAAKTTPPKPSAALWSMLDGDRTRGWTAQGIGSHKLRQVWVPSLALDLQSDVQLHLAARVSQSSQIDKHHSSISLRINDQPVATYSLADWKTAHAKVRVPAGLWQSKVWVMDFEVRLIPTAVSRCSSLIQEDYWVSIEPETHLEAKYNYKEALGIAGFWQRFSERPVLALAWSKATKTSPSAEQLVDFAPLLYAFLSNEIGRNNRRWLFVEKSECKSMACVVLHSRDSNTSTQDRLLAWRPALDRAPALAQSMPDLNVGGTAVIAWVPSVNDESEQLHMILGTLKGTALPTPQLSTFSGPIAVHTDKWQFLSSESVSAKSPLGADSESGGNTSVQQSRLRWVNLLWAFLSLAFVTVLAILYWRKKKKADPKTWEVG
jgi:Bacterial cellulose synthase subunit